MQLYFHRCPPDVQCWTFFRFLVLSHHPQLIVDINSPLSYYVHDLDTQGDTYTLRRIEFAQMNVGAPSIDGYVEAVEVFNKILIAYSNVGFKHAEWMMEGINFVRSNDATIVAFDLPSEDDTYLEFCTHRALWVLSSPQYRKDNPDPNLVHGSKAASRVPRLIVKRLPPPVRLVLESSDQPSKIVYDARDKSIRVLGSLFHVDNDHEYLYPMHLKEVLPND